MVNIIDDVSRQSMSQYGESKSNHEPTDFNKIAQNLQNNKKDFKAIKKTVKKTSGYISLFGE